MTRAGQLTDVVTHHGEGAGWDPSEGVFKVVDLTAGDLLTLAEDGSADRVHVGAVAAAWRPRAHGGTVVAVERGFVLLEGPDPVWGVEVWEDPALRMNDGACDPQGRFYCGSMAYDERPGAGTLWRLDPDRTVHRVRDGFTIPNGLVWSHDGAMAYHVDTPTQRIHAWDFDPDSGTLHGGSTFARVTGGAPDGMTMDAEGGLWVALWGGGAVHRYDDEGRLSGVVEVPARQVSSCAFGGPDLDRLLITTSRQGLPAGEDPRAGAVFEADPGVRGTPLLPFAG